MTSPSEPENVPDPEERRRRVRLRRFRIVLFGASLVVGAIWVGAFVVLPMLRARWALDEAKRQLTDGGGEAAATLAEQATVLDPNLAEAWVVCGQLRDDPVDGLVEIARGVMLDPDWLAALYDESQASAYAAEGIDRLLMGLDDLGVLFGIGTAERLLVRSLLILWGQDLGRLPAGVDGPLPDARACVEAAPERAAGWVLLADLCLDEVRRVGPERREAWFDEAKDALERARAIAPAMRFALLIEAKRLELLATEPDVPDVARRELHREAVVTFLRAVTEDHGLPAASRIEGDTRFDRLRVDAQAVSERRGT